MTAKLSDVLASLKVIQYGSLLIRVVAIIVGLVSTYFIANNICEPILEASNLAEKIANGNLQVEDLNSKSNDEIGYLMNSLNQMKENLNNMVAGLIASIEDLSAYSEELSVLAEEGNAIIETINQNVEQMASAIQQVSAGSQEVTDLAQEANVQTQNGNNNIKETVNNIGEINGAVSKTVRIINELDEYSEEIG